MRSLSCSVYALYTDEDKYTINMFYLSIYHYYLAASSSWSLSTKSYRAFRFPFVPHRSINIIIMTIFGALWRNGNGSDSGSNAKFYSIIFSFGLICFAIARHPHRLGSIYSFICTLKPLQQYPLVRHDFIYSVHNDDWQCDNRISHIVHSSNPLFNRFKITNAISR